MENNRSIKLTGDGETGL